MKAFAIGLVLAVVGCAGARPNPQTIDDIAAHLCAVVECENRPGLEHEEALKAFCVTREQLAPYISDLKWSKARAVRE